MRIRTNVRCLRCRTSFEVDDGDNATSHLLRCEDCGKPAAVEFDRLGWLYLRHLKWFAQRLPATANALVRELQALPCKPMPPAEYHRRVEAIAGSCCCGGDVTFDAVPRCPQCMSEDLADGWEVA